MSKKPVPCQDKMTADILATLRTLPVEVTPPCQALSQYEWHMRYHGPVDSVLTAAIVPNVDPDYLDMALRVSDIQAAATDAMRQHAAEVATTAWLATDEASSAPPFSCFRGKTMAGDVTPIGGGVQVLVSSTERHVMPKPVDATADNTTHDKLVSAVAPPKKIVVAGVRVTNSRLITQDPQDMY